MSANLCWQSVWLIAILGCGGVEARTDARSSGGGANADGDADGDSDADVDADGDSDADAGGDSDADADADVDGAADAGVEDRDCDDLDACTQDAFDPGDPAADPATGCVHTPVVCDDGISCTTDACDPSLGCSSGADSDACPEASGSQCLLDGTGTCAPGAGASDASTGCAYQPVDCSDDLACTVDECVDPFGCTRAPSHALCADGDDSTIDLCGPDLLGHDASTGCVATSCDRLCDGVVSYFPGCGPVRCGSFQGATARQDCVATCASWSDEQRICVLSVIEAGSCEFDTPACGLPAPAGGCAGDI